MSSLAIRRIIVWVVSMVLGLLVGYGIITVGFDMLPLFSAVQTPQGVSIEEYGMLVLSFHLDSDWAGLCDLARRLHGHADLA